MKKCSIYVATVVMKMLLQDESVDVMCIPVLDWDAFMDQKLCKGQLGRINVQMTAAQKQTAQTKIDEEIKGKTLEEPPSLLTVECSSKGASTGSCGSTRDVQKVLQPDLFL